MKIGFKLFASLTDYLPSDRQGNRVELDIEDDATIMSLVVRYRLPERAVHLVLVNGVFVPPSERATRRLAHGDEVAIWPPIAGG